MYKTVGKDGFKMKKILSVVLLVILVLTASLALAEDSKDEMTLEKLGITATLPEYYTRNNGFAVLLEKGIVSRKPFVSILAIEYFPLPMETYQQLEESIDSMTEEEIELIRNLFSVPAQLVVTDGDFEAVKPYLESEPVSDPVQLGSAEGYTYWYVPTVSEAYLQVFDGEDSEQQKAYEEELSGLRTEFLEDLKKASFFKPVDEEAEFVGQVISFTSKDLDGNTVTSAELFANNKVTMVNVWGTWCGNCTGEMGELAEIHKRLQEKGCGIVGVEQEYGITDEIAKEAREILSSNGVTYPNVLIPENDPVFDRIQGYPTTFFVDSEGKILTYPIVGAAVSEYEAAVDSLLNNEEVAHVEGKDAATNSGKAYRVIVYDKDGPVKGAVIQFCDPSTCTLGKTDAEGVATFDMPEGTVYDVHVLKVPAGYKKEAETYHTLDKYSDINIILEKE